MSARTDSESVQNILLDDFDSDHSLTGFIDSATAIVDRVNTCATAKGITLTSTELELIERWLTAHLYKCSDQQAAEEQTGKAKVKYGGTFGMGLESTKYGQMAMSMDYSGCLRQVTSGRRVIVKQLGLPPSEQTDYVDRD